MSGLEGGEGREDSCWVHTAGLRRKVGTPGQLARLSYWQAVKWVKDVEKKLDVNERKT